MQPTSTSHNNLLTRKQSASYLAVSQRKLDQLAASGELRRVKIDACVRFDRDDLDRFVEQKKTA